MNVHLLDEHMLQDLLKEESVCNDLITEKHDKELARMLDMDGVSISELIQELKQRSQQLYEKLSNLPSRDRPSVMSPHENISGD